jgi:hypothetical protein
MIIQIDAPLSLSLAARTNQKTLGKAVELLHPGKQIVEVSK